MTHADKHLRVEGSAVPSGEMSPGQDRGDGQESTHIIVHDFSGHPFQAQLSRQLARNGHRVEHLYCPTFSGPKGSLTVLDTDPDTLTIEGVDLGENFSKYSIVKRLRHEFAYGRQFGRLLKQRKPACLVSSNTPLFAGAVIMAIARRHKIPVVQWQQDIYTPAMAGLFKRRSALLGSLVGAFAMRIERSTLRSSSKVVVISEDFSDVLSTWGIDASEIEVIENWAPLDEITPVGRDNSWSARHGLENKRVLLYSGTLGLKHNPELLLNLARHVKDRTDVQVVVASQGIGMDWLKEHSVPEDQMLLLPFQKYEELSAMMASADVLLAILEPEAAVYSVPSKILSYHCAGRPVLASVPAENLAARILSRENSGIAVQPDATDAFFSAADDLLDDEDLRLKMGEAARSYAEREFAIEDIAARFEAIIAAALS